MKQQQEKKLFEDNDDLSSVYRQSIETSFILKNDVGAAPAYIDLPLDDQLFPADKDWNFFPELSATKMHELIISIADVGQLEPIIVWEQPDKRKMILSGHNRVAALKKLLEATGDSRFATVLSKVYKYEDLTESIAKNIIVITNYARRNLNTALIKKCIVYYYKNLSNQYAGNRLLHTAVTFGMSKRMVQYYLNISQLIDPFLNLLNENRISISVVPILSKFSAADQEWLYTNFADHITNEKISSLNSRMNKTQIRQILLRKEKKYINLTYSVPEESIEEVNRRIETLLKEMGIDTQVKHKNGSGK